MIIKNYGEISKQLDDNEWLIERIDVKYNNQLNNIIVINRRGETLFTTDMDYNINWDTIYNNYGLDDYHIVYPGGIRRLHHHRKRRKVMH
jgi:hypothetical protein